MQYSKMHTNRHKPLAAAMLLACGSMACPLASAATIPVTNCNDSGNGSLRAAIAEAQNGDTVDMSVLTCSTITLTTGLTVAQNDLTLQGPGADKLAISGTYLPYAGPASIYHRGTGTLQINALHLFSYEFGSPFYGSGAIKSNGKVSIDAVSVFGEKVGVQAKTVSTRNSTINYNAIGLMASGGDISLSTSTFFSNRKALEIDGNADQSVVITNSTISGNASVGTISGQTTTINNSTIASNINSRSNLDMPTGLSINSPNVTIQSSIFANNNIADLIVTGATSIAGGHNLVMVGQVSAALPADTISADPKLLPLDDNGGPTHTQALGAGSPAIDTGSNTANLATDQRGSPRRQGAGTDIGAFEVQIAQSAGTIGPGYTGSWYDPNQSGHGIVVEVLEGNHFLAYWFTFNPDGTQQAWFVGAGTYQGNTATITDVAQPAGGAWIPNFDPNQVANRPWGTLTFTFTDCNHGRVDFASGVAGYGSGHMDLTRLTMPAGLSCQ